MTTGLRQQASRGRFITVALRLLGYTLVLCSLWLVDLVGVALLWTNAAGAARQDDLTKSLITRQLPPSGGKVGPLRSTAPPPIGTALGRLEIARLRLAVTVVQGAGLEQLTYGPGHLASSALPGRRGNAVIAGHRTTWGRPFAHLDLLHPGDVITFTDSVGRATYVVAKSFIVKPTATLLTSPTATNVLTLLTCTPPHFATNRLVVRATLSSTLPTGTVGPSSLLRVVAPRSTSASGATLLAWIASVLSVVVFAIATFRTPRWWRTVGLVIAILAALTLGNVLLVQQLPAGF